MVIFFEDISMIFFINAMEIDDWKIPFETIIVFFNILLEDK